MLIGLVGKKQAGKDTFGQYLIQQYGFQKRAFADPIKECCQLLFHLREEQLHDAILKETIDTRWNQTPRQIMQMVGTDLFRNHYDPDFWIKSFEQWYHNSSSSSTHVVCTDVRFPNEAECIRSLGGVLVQIIRPTILSTDLHESEQCIIQADYRIMNDSTLENFHDKIQSWCETYLYYG